MEFIDQSAYEPVKQRVLALCKQGGRDLALYLLRSFGVEVAYRLPPAQYAAFIGEADRLMGVDNIPSGQPSAAPKPLIGNEILGSTTSALAIEPQTYLPVAPVGLCWSPDRAPSSHQVNPAFGSAAWCLVRG